MRSAIAPCAAVDRVAATAAGVDGVASAITPKRIPAGAAGKPVVARRIWSPALVPDSRSVCAR
jgi:hypothetical protein